MTATYINDPSSGAPDGRADSMSDFGTDSQGQRNYYIAEIKASDEEAKHWRQRATRVVKRYRDVREDGGLAPQTKRYNMLWSIINTTMPAVYGRPPKPIVMRRYTDPDQVARVASLMLERTLDFQLAAQSDFQAAIRHALQDRLLPGMGCVWVRYQKDQTSPTDTIDNDYYARLAGNLAAVDFVYWEDFGFTSARVWEEVPLVWRVVYMTRDQLVERFGDKIGKAVPLDYTPARHNSMTDSTMETDEPRHKVFNQAKIYELWDKRNSKVSWLSLHYPTLLDQKDDPMNFPGFFPCPRPMFATNTTGNLVPVPDYCMYQDQANEIDLITQRLYMLTIALKVVGVYDQTQEGIQRMLTEGVDNQLIPVDTWAAFAEKGGIKGTVDFFPLEVVIEVVEKLYNIREQLIQDIYQITGLSDIIRGASNPNETLGAQKIKAQFASVRLNALQQDLARFVTETLQLMAHVVVSLFDNTTIVDQSAIMQSPDGQTAIKNAQAAIAQRMAPPPGQQPPPMPQGPGGQPGGMLPPPSPLGANVVPFPTPEPPGPQGVIEQALQLLRKGKTLDYRIEVASDTMIQPDLDDERDQRNAFLTSITQFMQQAIPAAQQTPQLMPIIQALMMFGVRGFRSGREIEGIIESTFTEMQNSPAPPKPDPKQQALEAQGQLAQQKMQMDMQAKQQEGRRKMQESQAQMQMEMQKMQNEMQMQSQKLAAEVQAIREKAQADVEAILIKANVQAEVARNQQAQQAEAQSQAVQGDVMMRAQEMAHNQATHEQAMEQQAEMANPELEQAESPAKEQGEGE
jgi:hypothetical protein